MNSSHDDEITAEQGQQFKLKHLPHWPPVQIDFEDIICTAENGNESN